MSEAPESGGGSVRPLTALAFTTIGFVALVIFGLGMTSLATGEDVIDTPGLGQAPGVTGVVLATAAYAAALWAAIGRSGRGSARTRVPDGARVPGDRADAGGADASAPPQHPSYWAAAWTTAASFLAYLAGVCVAAIVTGTGPALAAAVAGRLATSWFGGVVAAAAFVCAWSGIALVRTHAARPRWPWEDEFDE